MRLLSLWSLLIVTIVRGYKEKGNIDTPLELAIRNDADRYSLAMLAIDNLKSVLGNKGGDVRERLNGDRTRARNHAYVLPTSLTGNN